jgi:hypothetical protein
MAKDDPLARLDRALGALERHIMSERAAGLRARVDRGLTDPLNRSGLCRQLRPDLDDAINVERPDWTVVRALHRAWVSASAWSRMPTGAVDPERTGG